MFSAMLGLRAVCRSFLIKRSPQLITSAKCSSFEKSKIQIAVTDDGRTIVCYHPAAKQEFPYECTRPLPRKELENSLMKPEFMNQKPARPMTEEDLIRLAYRPRAAWRSQFRAHKRHILPKKSELDRIGI